MDRQGQSFYRYRRLGRNSGQENPPVIITRLLHPNHRMHAHDFIEMVIVNGGEGVHLLETGEYPICAGDIFIIPRGIRHGYRNVRNFRITNLLFKLSTVERRFPEIATLPGFLHFFRAENSASPPGRLLNLDSVELATVEKLQQSILREQEGREPGSDSMCLACLAELLIFVCRLLEKRAPQPPLPHREFVEVCFHINARYREPLRVKELAALARMSVRSFQRHFTRVNGVSPIGYVKKVRLEKARELLRYSDRGVAQIAAECGFSGASVLGTEFRREFGVTPGEFRRHARPEAGT